MIYLQLLGIVFCVIVVLGVFSAFYDMHQRAAASKMMNEDPYLQALDVMWVARGGK